MPINERETNMLMMVPKHTNDTLNMSTYSIGNQSPQSSLTLSMSSWQRKRSWTSLRAVGGTTSLIHTYRDQERPGEAAKAQTEHLPTAYMRTVLKDTPYKKVQGDYK